MGKQPTGARTRRRAALAALAAGALVAGGPAALAAAHGNGGDRVRTVVGGLASPRGLAEHHGKLVVTLNDGTFSLIVRHGHKAKVVKLGKLKTQGWPAVDVGRDGTVWLLTGGGGPAAKLPPGAATLYQWRPGFKKPKPFANIGAYQAHDPDPFDLEKNPTDSNPFGVAALEDGSVLVADAGGNDLLHVSADGKSIETVARLKPRVVKIPKGLPSSVPGEGGEPPTKIPPAGTPVPAEAVATSVTVGPDGYWYVGELRGFPATPRTSEIWRIAPGTTNAVCDPKHPDAGDCQRFADGLTSIMDLAASKHGDAVYAVEMSKKSWLKVELKPKNPRVAIGALIKVSQDGGLTELAPGRLLLPGGVAVGEHGDVFVAGPIFGRGSVVEVRGHGGHGGY